MFGKLFIVADLIADMILSKVEVFEFLDQARRAMYRRPAPEEKGKTICWFYMLEEEEITGIFKSSNPTLLIKRIVLEEKAIAKLEKGIQEIMDHHHLTAAQMSEMFGMSRQSLRDWSCGRSKPQHYVLNLIEWALDYPVKYKYDESASVKELTHPTSYISKVIGIPQRTVEDWRSGRRKSTKYVESLVCSYMTLVEGRDFPKRTRKLVYPEGVKQVNDKMRQLFDVIGADQGLLKYNTFPVEQLLDLLRCDIGEDGEIIDRDNGKGTGIYFDQIKY